MAMSLHRPASHQTKRPHIAPTVIKCQRIASNANDRFYITWLGGLAPCHSSSPSPKSSTRPTPPTRWKRPATPAENTPEQDSTASDLGGECFTSSKTSSELYSPPPGVGPPLKRWKKRLLVSQENDREGNKPTRLSQPGCEEQTSFAQKRSG